MSIDFSKIREENIIEYGKGNRHLRIYGHLYAQKEHFIYEILQNAEDANAHNIGFDLYNDFLIIYHDGKPFDEHDVRGVCGIGEGTKAEDDFTHIGRFGIGFKSVYAITSSPSLLSGNIAFRILGFIKPYGIDETLPEGSPQTIPVQNGHSNTLAYLTDFFSICSGEILSQETIETFSKNVLDKLKKGKTVFLFPFNDEKIKAVEVYEKIEKKLTILGARTLLFLRNISEIEWNISSYDEDGILKHSSGIYLKQSTLKRNHSVIEVIGEKNQEYHKEKWILFRRAIEAPQTQCHELQNEINVEIAFFIQDENSPDTIQRLSESPLFAFFATDLETHLGFYIQGPYRTTPVRDKIPQDDSWNQKLIEETAVLLTQALHVIRDEGMLNVNLLNTLPINEQDFKSDSMFRPFFDKILATLKNEPLLPSDDGGYIPSTQAVLARGGDDLRELLGPEQLNILMQNISEPKWLTGEITENRTRSLHNYLTKNLAIIEIDPEYFARIINKHFMSLQSDQWLIDFYQFLLGRVALWRKDWSNREAILRRKPIIRLEDEQHVPPFDQNDLPCAYLPPDGETDYPVIKKEIALNENAKSFLIKLGLSEPELADEVLTRILPRYKSSSIEVTDILKHKKDMKRIIDSLHVDSSEKREKIISTLKATPFILTENKALGKKDYKKPSEAYIPSDELLMYFKDNDEIWFIDDYENDIVKILKSLGVSDKVRITLRDKKDWQGDLIISDYWGSHVKGIGGFDPSFEIDGLNHALKSINAEKARYIWNTLILPFKIQLKGTVKSSSRQDFSGAETETLFSIAGKLLYSTEWLPDKYGNFFQPSELELEDLQASFERDDTLIRALEIRTDNREKAQFAEKLGVDIEHINLIKRIRDEFPELLTRLKEEVERKSRANNFFEAAGNISISDSKHLAAKTSESYQEAPEKSYEQRTMSVRSSMPFIDPRTWLYSKYSDTDSRLYCQLCSDEMPFKKRNDQYYFEAIRLFDEIDKEMAELYCALCPNCAAKYKEYIKSNDSKSSTARETLKSEILLNGTQCTFEIEVPGASNSLRFRQDHLIRLCEILKEADKN